MILVESLSHQFGSKLVLNNINFQVVEGEILTVMGSSGGGKTTLLKCIAGLLTATSGQISIGRVSLAENPDRARLSMGMVFQSAALFDSLTVEGNVLFGVKRHLNLNKKQEQSLLQDCLFRVGLTGSERLYPAELSGGMRKRVGIARAIALSPKVLLYDEPTTGLDPITTYQIDQLMVDLRDKLQVTSVVVSHDLSSVCRVADRVAFLHKGELVFLGPPEDFLVAPHPAIQEVVQKSQALTLN